ncbi:MAG: polysaccharide deacetylase family protein, partial [Edaphobacter sp.]
MIATQLATTAVLATAATAGAFAYAALWPASQLFGQVLVAGSNPNETALTYDDGPNDDATERLLEVLARHEV